jgi:hypothetical protein
VVSTLLAVHVIIITYIIIPVKDYFDFFAIGTEGRPSHHAADSRTSPGDLRPGCRLRLAPAKSADNPRICRRIGWRTAEREREE